MPNIDIYYNYSKLSEKVAMWLVWQLPRRLVYWCAIRLVAHATTGDYSNTVVPDLSAMDAIRRW